MRNDESREPPRNASAPECSRPEARTSASIRGVPGTALCFPWPVRSERVTHNADTWQPTTSASRVRRRSMEAGRRSPEQQSVERSSFNPPTRIRFGRDVPFTPLCCPLTSRPGARCAQCACLAIHGERSEGASSKHGGRPPLARAAWSPPLRFSHDHADRATLGDNAGRRWKARRPAFRVPSGTRPRTKSPPRLNAELELGGPHRRPAYRVPPGTRPRPRSPQRLNAELELGDPHRRPAITAPWGAGTTRPGRRR